MVAIRTLAPETNVPIVADTFKLRSGCITVDEAAISSLHKATVASLVRCEQTTGSQPPAALTVSMTKHLSVDNSARHEEDDAPEPRAGTRANEKAINTKEEAHRFLGLRDST